MSVLHLQTHPILQTAHPRRRFRFRHDSAIRIVLLLLLLVLLLVGGRGMLRAKWRDLPLLVLLGALLFAVFPATFNASLRLIEASRGALLLATIPLWSALLARMARSERLSPRQVVGVFLSLGGVGLALAERGLGWQAA